MKWVCNWQGLHIPVSCTSQDIWFINAVLDMDKKEAILLQIVRRIGNKHHMKVWIWFQIWTLHLYILRDKGKNPSLHYITVLQ